MRLRTRALLIASALVPITVGSGLLGASKAAAAGEPGSAFQSLSLRAVSGGQQFFGDTLAATAPGSAAGGVPWATAELGGSSAHSLASVAWPGALAGNAGSLLLLLGPSPCLPGDDPATHQPIPLVGGTCDEAVPIPQPVMDQYHYLNTPVRAEAQFPTQPSASQAVPGATMEAATTATSAASAAILGGGYSSETASFGTSRAASHLEVTGPKAARGMSSSLLKDLSFAGGVVTIDSVVSRAFVTTTGTSATAVGGTTISGLAVGGIPVTVDGDGIHANGSTAPATPAVEAVKSLLVNAGIQMFVTTPTRQVEAGKGSYRAGTLVLVMDVDQAGRKDDVIVVIGGAEASAAATLPYSGAYPLPPSLPGGQSGLPGSSDSPLVPGQPGFGASPLPGTGEVTPSVNPGGGGVSLAGFRLSAGWSGGTLLALGLLLGVVALLAGQVPRRLVGASTEVRCEEGISHA